MSLVHYRVISDKIYRSDTDQPILNVTVSLVNPSLDKKDPAYTIAEIKVDEQGQFGFNNLKPGEYELDILEEELSEDALPCIDSGSVTFDQSGKTVKETFAYTENDKFYLLQIIPSVTVSVGNMTENDVDMYCSNW